MASVGEPTLAADYQVLDDGSGLFGSDRGFLGESARYVIDKFSFA